MGVGTLSSSLLTVAILSDVIAHLRPRVPSPSSSEVPNYYAECSARQLQVLQFSHHPQSWTWSTTQSEWQLYACFWPWKVTFTEYNAYEWEEDVTSAWRAITIPYHLGWMLSIRWEGVQYSPISRYPILCLFLTFGFIFRRHWAGTQNKGNSSRHTVLIIYPHLASVSPERIWNWGHLLKIWNQAAWIFPFSDDISSQMQLHHYYICREFS